MTTPVDGIAAALGRHAAALDAVALELALITGIGAARPAPSASPVDAPSRDHRPRIPLDDVLVAVADRESPLLQRAFDEAWQHGTSLRLLVPIELLPVPTGLREQVEDLDGEVRVRRAIEAEVLVARNGTALRSGDTGERGAVQLATPDLVRGAAELFASWWSAAAELPTADDPGSLDDLLQLGASDPEIAEALGFSLRSVQRAVAARQKAFGVHSRFALGLALARLRQAPSSRSAR